MSVGDLCVKVDPRCVKKHAMGMTRSNLELIVERGDDEDVHYLKVIHGTHFQKAIKKIAEFADDDTDTTGGTMGLPHICPEWMKIVQSCLLRSFCNAP